MSSQNKKNPSGHVARSGYRTYISELVDEAPGGIVLVTADAHILYANRVCDIYLGHISRLTEALHADDRSKFDFALTRLRLDPSHNQRVEMRLLKADGADMWMLAELSAAGRNTHGTVEEILIQLADIDQQKRTELEMQSWAQRWNHALVGSTLGVWDHNFATGQFYYSETWKTMRGYAPDAAVDTSMEGWIESVHPDDRAMLLDEVERQSRGNFSPLFCYRERHTAGHYIWIECRGACMERYEDGRPSRVIGTDIDVTERKAAEQRLLELSRKLELALDVSHIGVFEVDVERGTTHWDERMLEIYGLQGTSAVQESDGWFDMIHPEDRERAIGRIRENAGKDTTFSNAFRIRRPDGDIRHIRARVTPFRLESGETRILGANWDATNDITIQQELAEANRLAEARNRELEEAKAHIEHSALHDFLTGLPNRRYLDAELVDRADRPDRGTAILHLDLDRFKQINDTLGHLAGDHMLQHTAKILRESIGPSDFVARIGGDEFVILSSFDGSTKRLTELAERVIRRMREPVVFENHPCRIGASIGIAFAAGASVDPKQLLLNADIALYRAKMQGRNRFEYFSFELQNDVIQTKRLSDEILAGLERGEFVPHYQLQFRAADLSVAGVETLARWQHPERGLLTPDKFLQVAEDLDVVAAIDKMILEKAVADHALWRNAGLDIPKVSVNVSARRLADPGLADSLRNIDIPAGALSFELLETIFLDDYDEAVSENLRQIRKLGIGIEIDDFGTGHASIVSLLKTGPGTLKIDRELVAPLTTALEQRRLVGSIIEMGKSLGIKVVGEGVETMAHVRILQRLGCDILQGFALARPMASEKIGGFVREGAWKHPRD